MQVFQVSPPLRSVFNLSHLEVNVDNCGPMVLDALFKIKEQDPTLAFRRSCREGICGSCTMNIVLLASFFIQLNLFSDIRRLELMALLASRKSLRLWMTKSPCAFTLFLTWESSKVLLFSPPSFLNVADLVPDLNNFYAQHKAIKPWLVLTPEEEASPKVCNSRIRHELISSSGNQSVACGS